MGDEDDGTIILFPGTVSLIDFHARILELSHAYQWESVLTLALTFHTERIVLGITDIKAWQMPSALIDEHLRTAVKPNITASATPRSTAPNAPTEFCHRWNNGDCNWSPCRRKHTCSQSFHSDFGSLSSP